ncbi:N-acetyllactosaminide alpha-1,3-galactosyltransferase-like isoform X2 [Scyliorhinus torazame]|uniref:N-acetyllactosaminide alpha-1,3-galactosyltransferase-like isoform X2 n=1 Tax=Scyliorhinus torazame TaxID=75743 RepID=UPI003B5C8303
MQCKWNKHNRVAFLVLCTALFYVLYRIYAPLSHSAVTGEPTMTSWGAPIVWTGTYDPVERDEYYKRRKTVIGMTVFAVGRYIDRFLKDFLETAEQHFMRGQRVIYYVLVDNVSKVPALKLSPERTMTVLHVPKFSRWQDISMMRMEQISTLIQERIRHEVTYLFCLDVDLLFVGHFGPEALGDLVAQLQAGVYPNAPKSFTFEQRPQSAAYIAPGQGDYYYHAALFGGRPELVYNLTRACMAGVSKDKVTGIEAVWHEESHLNRYFLDHKPTKLLSHEFCWDRTPRSYIKLPRIKWIPEEYKIVRGA